MSAKQEALPLSMSMFANREDFDRAVAHSFEVMAAQNAAYAEGRADQRQDDAAVTAALLEALIEMVDGRGPYPDCVLRARAAISLATQTTEPK